MNEDIRISTDFPSHRKTQKLYRKLGAEGCFSLVKLWATIANQRPDGDLSGYDKDDIEIDAGWPGKNGEFFKAIIEIGFIDKTNEGYSLHNWELRQPWAIGDIVRSEKGRFNRLIAYNKDVFNVLQGLGYTQINKIDYQRISKIGNAEKKAKSPLSPKEIENQVFSALGISKKIKSKNNSKYPQATLGGDLEGTQATLGGDHGGTLSKPLTPTPAPAPAPIAIHQNSSSDSTSYSREDSFCPGCDCQIIEGAYSCPACGLSYGGDF